VDDGWSSYLIPDKAQERLEQILDPYTLSAFFFLDGLKGKRNPPPWAYVCLSREYPLAKHIWATRTPESQIAFSPYSKAPEPIPEDFVPTVGALVLFSKEGLESVANRSLLFEWSWNGLSDCSQERNWLVFLDPLPEEWLRTVAP